VNERKHFTDAHQRGVSVLCRRFGISRKTGYKWAGRYFELGATGLVDGSRCPHSSPTAVEADPADDYARGSRRSLRFRSARTGTVSA
jgi:hypothetical protein